MIEEFPRHDVGTVYRDGNFAVRVLKRCGRFRKVRISTAYGDSESWMRETSLIKMVNSARRGSF